MLGYFVDKRPLQEYSKPSKKSYIEAKSLKFGGYYAIYRHVCTIPTYMYYLTVKL